jgi:phytoene/squalene synthetase
MLDHGKHLEIPKTLAASITRAASSQTYYTIRLLVDRDRVLGAYRAYAYFRWVDDWLDQEARAKSERLTFVDRQKALIDHCYQGEKPRRLLADEETMLVDLIQGDRGKTNGLQTYIRNMMAVMAFDAERRGRLISRDELTNYTRWLAVAVTEAMHYFIGHDSPSLHGETRYHAVTAAHITHMLRDTREDIKAGYFNIPREFLEAHGINPWDTGREAYRTWVQRRVQLARACFDMGKDYLARVANPRCRLAGFAYTARFEGVLDSIKRDGYQLRSEYPERKSMRSGIRMVWSALSLAFDPRRRDELPRAITDQVRGQR